MKLRAGPDSTSLTASDSVVESGTPVRLAWISAQSVAERANGFRVVVDLFARQLYVIEHNDTPYAGSIGASVTHGCVRLADDDIQ